MNCKKRFFVILMFFCLVTLNLVNAYTTYINIYIVDLDTNTASESDPIQLVDHANSAIQWKLSGTGCIPTSYQDDIAVGEYGNGNIIVTGSTATLTEGSLCTLYLKVDEVKVGSYYYGSCTTDGTGTACKDCGNSEAVCPAQYLGTPTNAYLGQSISSAGAAGACNADQDFGRCSEEIVDQLDDTLTTEFTFTFTA